MANQMAKKLDTIDYKLWPCLEGILDLKWKPSDDLNDLLEDLTIKANRRNGFLEKPDDLAYIVLQDWAFGKITKKQAFNKLEALDYLEWEII